jgi:hypothetical protein
MPHLLCFLAARIAQPHVGPERAAVRPECCIGSYHSKLCKIADRLVECALHILKRICEIRRGLLAPARLRGRRQDCSCHWVCAAGLCDLRFWALCLGPFAVRRFVLGARE